MARTHTELYRRFEGELKPRSMRFLPLFSSGVRTSLKKKIPLLLLFAPVVMGSIVYSFIVYGKYAMEEQTMSVGGIDGMAAVFAQRAMLNIEVKNQIAEFNHVMRIFALLVVAWFGAGLLADDRRLGAHQLYFARPLTRLDYFLGKFLTVAFFGCCAILFPGLFICLMASWSSPEWSFIKEEGDVIWRTLAYAAIWITLVSSVVLAVSSVVKKKTFALAGVFGFFMLNYGMGGVLGTVQREYRAISLIHSQRRVRNWLFQIDDWKELGFGLDLALLAIGITITLSLLIVAWRLRRLEVVR